MAQAQAADCRSNKNEKKDNIKTEDVEVIDTSKLSEDEYLKLLRGKSNAG